MRFAWRFRRRFSCTLCDQVSKSADRKIKMRTDFGRPVTPVDQLQCFFHTRKSLGPVPMQRFPHIFAHTHPHRARARQ